MRTPIIIIAFALGTIACKAHEPSYTGGSEEPGAWGQEQAVAGEPVDELVENPPYGQQVTVKGEIEKLYGPRMFTMNSGLFQEDLLVISQQDVQLADPDSVQVQGRVEKMVVAEVEEKFDLKFDNAVKIAYEGRPYVVAETVERLPDDKTGLFQDGEGDLIDDEAGEDDEIIDDEDGDGLIDEN